MNEKINNSQSSEADIAPARTPASEQHANRRPRSRSLKDPVSVFRDERKGKTEKRCFCVSFGCFGFFLYFVSVLRCFGVSLRGSENRQNPYKKLSTIVYSVQFPILMNNLNDSPSPPRVDKKDP